MKLIFVQIDRLHEEKKYPHAELKFLEETAEVIKKCRVILKWTYACRYLVKFSEQEEARFLFSQSWLEDNCERAHQLLDTNLNKFIETEDPDRKPFWDFKEDVLNKLTAL